MSKRRKRRAAKTVVFIVLAVLLFSLLIFSLYKMDFMSVIEFIPSLFEKDDEQPSSAHSEKIKELIELLEKNEGGYESIGLDNVSAIEMLDAAPAEASYYHSYSVQYTSGEYTNIKNVVVTRYEKEWKIVVKDGTASQNTVSFDGNEYTVRDDMTGEERRFSKESGMSFEGQSYLTPLTEIKAMLSEYEASSVAGKPSALTDVEAQIVRTQTDNLILISFKYGETGQSEEYMIHLDYGVIVSAAASLDGKEYYKVTTNVFDPEYKMK